LKLSFHGADRGVTGSCHLVECAGKRVLIDCGLYQGGRELGEETPVRARIHTINGFSAHADRDELLAWQRQVGAARTFLVHGEEEIMRQFVALLSNTHVEMPAQGQDFTL